MVDMNLLMRRIAALGSVLVFVAAVFVLSGWREGYLFQAPRPVPLTNANCSGGYVVFSFDGGPLAPPLVAPRWSSRLWRGSTRRVCSSFSAPPPQRTRR